MIGMGSVVALKAANDNTKLSEGYARLMRSLDGLMAALDRQSEAVADFRGNCERLETSVGRCSDGMKRYQDKLEEIDTGSLKRASEALSRTAEDWVDSFEEGDTPKDERDEG